MQSREFFQDIFADIKEAAIRGMIGCYEGALDIDDLQNFRKKYGRQVAVYYIPPSMQG